MAAASPTTQTTPAEPTGRESSEASPPRDSDPDTTAATTTDPTPAASRRSRRKRWLALLLMLIALLIAARLALVPLVIWQVNAVLDQDPLYEGEIQDLSLSLWRGAYTIYGIRLDKKLPPGGGGESSGRPLLTVDQLDLSLQWPALLRGKIVGEVDLLRPVVTFVDAPGSGPGSAGDQTGADGAWLQMLQDLLPFTINRVTVQQGEAYFFGLAASEGGPPTQAYLTQIQAQVTDLTNVRDRVKPLITQVQMSAKAMDQAPVQLEVALDPFSYRPTFDLAMRMLDFDVTQINELAQAYGGLDFKGGWFDLTVEAEANNGLIEGEIKPLFRHLEVFAFDQDIEQAGGLEGLASAAWELLVGATAELLENQRRDQVGTRIPFTQDTTGLDYDLLEVVGNVLYNAFVQAYLPKLRHESQTIGDDGWSFQAPEAVPSVPR